MYYNKKIYSVGTETLLNMYNIQEVYSIRYCRLLENL